MADSSERVARHRAKQRYIDEAGRLARIDALSRVGQRMVAQERVEDLVSIDVEARVSRARAYAEWRWEGVLDGSVDSL